MDGSDVFLVFVDGKPGHEENYADWFGGEHMADMRRLPGVARAFAGKLSALDGEPPPAQLCGYYETPDCGELLSTIAASRGTPALPASDLQGRMVWRVLETTALHGEWPEPQDFVQVLICMFTAAPDEFSIADLPIVGARWTRIGAIQPARGREHAAVLFLMLPEGIDPAAIAAMIAQWSGASGARFLLAGPA